MATRNNKVAAGEAAGAVGGPGKRTADAEVERVIDEVRAKLIEALKLDAKTAAYIYEDEREDNRFAVDEITKEGEIFIKIGPVECINDKDGSYTEVALTVSEAIALALRLIRYAAEANAKSSQ
jgi:hypothetical protein